MNFQYLQDLCRHQAWADAEHWRALDTCPAALADKGLRQRLHHLVEVQYIFLRVARGEKFERLTLTPSAEPQQLREQAQQNHQAYADFLSGEIEARLGEIVTLPWFQNPPIQITVAEALTQVVMHSQGHRAQNAVRLRELGGKAPMTDFIVWLWKGRPLPEWN
ncbi:MAG: DinB family protein [Bryobacteraceae bacterium]